MKYGEIIGNINRKHTEISYKFSVIEDKSQTIEPNYKI